MRSKTSNYRWVIAIICFSLFFLVIGLGTMPHNLYIVPVTEHFGFTRGEFSLVFSIITIIGLLIQLLFGLLVQRLGIRLIVSLGLPLIPIGYFIFSKASNLMVFYLGAICVGVGFSCSSLTSVSILINNWFPREQQGKMLGIIAAGSGFGGSLFSLIIGNHIASNGFQASYFLTAAILALAAVPIIVFLRSKPGNSDNPLENDYSNKQKLDLTTSNHHTNGSYLKQNYVLLTLLMVFLIGVIVAPLNQNTPPFLIEKGFDPIFAANIASAVFFIQAISKILLGIFNDRFGIKMCLYVGLGSFVIGVLFLIFSTSVWTVWAYALFGGIAMSSIAVISPLYIKHILGNENYEKYIGLFMAAINGGIGLGNPIINFTYDLSGTYRTIFACFGGIGIITLIFSILSLKMKEKYLQETKTMIE